MTILAGMVGTAITAINADPTEARADVPTKVTLSQSYLMFFNPQLPWRSSYSAPRGSDARAWADSSSVLISSGTTITVSKCEADAIVNAGAGSYA